MKSDPIIFDDLSKLLTRLGFKLRAVSGPQTVFQHIDSDTLIVLPHYEPQDVLRAMHLASTRKLLIEKDLITQAAFDGYLEKTPN
jgi:predicted RNA binding protein YcfA (HicA-like mRNA interferase family)